MEILIFFLRICLVSSVLVAVSSSGLDLLSPFSSPLSPLPETSKGFGQAPISSPEPHKSGNAPPPKASQPSLPPLADVVAPPPSDSDEGKAPAAEPIVLVPNAPAPATIPVKDLPGKSPPVKPIITPIASPPQFIPSDAPKEPPFSGRVTPGPVSSPVSDIPPFPSVALPPPTPSIVPPRNASNNHKPKPIAPASSPPTISIDISPPVHTKVNTLKLTRYTVAELLLPTSTPTKRSPRRYSPVTHPVFPIESPAVSPDHAANPVKHSPPSDNGDDNKSPVAAPSNETAKPLPVFPHKASPPSIVLSAPKFNGHSHHTSPLHYHIELRRWQYHKTNQYTSQQT